MKTNIIMNGDVLHHLKELPDESIDMVMTSPPYWALRDYGESVVSIWGGDSACEHEFSMQERQLHSGSTSDEWKKDMSKGMQGGEWKSKDGFCSKCGAWKGQLGLEPTFELYIKHLCDVFSEVKRVLKKEGTCWVNIGDTYGTKSGSGFEGDLISKDNSGKGIKIANELRGISPEMHKNLCNIPARFSIEMQNRKWILRNDIVWFKRNSMPSSVKDRLANKWEHIFFFVKSKKYYFDLDAIRKPYLSTSVNSINAGFSPSTAFNYRVREAVKGTLTAKFGDKYTATEGEKTRYKKNTLRYQHRGDTDPDAINPLGGNPGDHWDITTRAHPFAHFAVYPEQLCEMPIKAGSPVGGVVLDPFFGSGTTGLVALKLGRQFIGIELNPEYIKIANERLRPILEQQTIPNYIPKKEEEPNIILTNERTK